MKKLIKEKKIKRIKKKPIHSQLGLKGEIKNNKIFIKWSTKIIRNQKNKDQIENTNT